MKRKYKKVVPVGSFGTGVFINLGGVNGTEEEFNTIPGVSEFTLEIETETDNYQDWAEGNYDKVFAGSKSITVSGTMTFYEGDEVHKYFQTVALEKTLDEDMKSIFRWNLPNNRRMESYVFMNFSSFGGAVNGKIEMEFEFTFDGAPEFEDITQVAND